MGWIKTFFRWLFPIPPKPDQCEFCNRLPVRWAFGHWMCQECIDDMHEKTSW